jgi:hypothetical protein
MLRHLPREDRRWLKIQRAVWSDFVVMHLPFVDDLSCLIQRLEPVLVETAFAEPAIERLHKGDLNQCCRARRLTLVL